MLAWFLTRLGLSGLLAPLIVAALITAGAGAAYLKGRSDQSASCREAELRAEIAALRRDLQVRKAADAFEEQAMSDLKAEAERMQQEIARYASELERRQDHRCLLNERDIDWLRRNRP